MANTDYIITTDSDTELPLSIAKAYNVTFVPMDYMLEGREYFYDLGETTDFKGFFDAMRAGKLPSTSTYPPQYYMDLWRPMLEAGKDVLHLSFSGKLSAAFTHLSGAAEMLNEEFAASGRRVVPVDLLGISGGAAVLVYEALQKQAAGNPLDAVADWVRANTVNAQHWFTVNDLIHLHRGGRLSAANAIVGTMLSVKPILMLNKEGRIIAFDKVKGRKRAIAYLAERVWEFADKPEETAVVILHGDCLEDGQELQRLVETKVKFKETFLQYVGPVIGTHAGPDVLGICFMGKERPV